MSWLDDWLGRSTTSNDNGSGSGGKSYPTSKPHTSDHNQHLHVDRMSNGVKSHTDITPDARGIGTMAVGNAYSESVRESRDSK